MRPLLLPCRSLHLVRPLLRCRCRRLLLPQQQPLHLQVQLLHLMQLLQLLQLPRLHILQHRGSGSR